MHAAGPRCGDVRLVCIDGPAGSGKTTLAGELAGALGAAPVIHMDDLYEGWDQDLGEVLAARVRSWLIDPWEQGGVGLLRRYDWGLQRFGSPEPVPPAPVMILEGCASASAGIRRSASLVVWIEAPRSVGLARGLARDGDALTPAWLAWQEREAAHFASDRTREAADVLLST